MKRLVLPGVLMLGVVAPVAAQGIINRDTGGVTNRDTGGILTRDTGGVANRDTGGVKTVLPSIQADHATDGSEPATGKGGEKGVVVKKVVKTISPSHMGPRGMHEPLDDEPMNERKRI